MKSDTHLLATNTRFKDGIPLKVACGLTILKPALFGSWDTDQLTPGTKFTLEEHKFDRICRKCKAKIVFGEGQEYLFGIVDGELLMKEIL